MKKTILLLICGLTLHLSYAQQKDIKKLTTKFDKILEAHFKSGETGATVLVSRKNQIIYKKAFGMANLELNVPMKVDHIFRIGSITKQFTAVAILQLMEQGKLSLQDDITKFIPDYPTHGYKITIEHLLTHTSGIQCYTGMKDYAERITLDVTPTEMIDHFKYQPMKFAPGTQYSYNNSGYFLLGYIIEKASGKSYADYLEENLFKPLGMTNSHYASDSKIIKNRVGAYRKGENGIENAKSLSMTQPYAAGSILSTVEDLYKWNQSVISYKLIKKETLDKAFAKHKLTDSTETDYGYGWRLGYVQESPTVEHGGGINGSLTMAIYLPVEDVFVTVFSNCECKSPQDITSKLAALTIGKPYDYKEISIESNIIKEYIGVYENNKGELRIISFSDNQLYSQRGRNKKLKIKSYQKDRFFFDEVLVTIDFFRNAKGEIVKLTTISRDGSEVWTKTNKPVPIQTEIITEEKILETYVGEYEISPDFQFTVTKVKNRLFVQATGQEKFEIGSETATKFFSKVNDALFEFVKDDSGKVIKAILNQGGRTVDAKKIK